MHLAARALIGTLLLCTVLTTISNAADSAARPPKHGERFPMAGTVIVKFEQDLNSPLKVGVREVDAMLDAHGLESIQPFAPFATPRKPGGADLSRIHLVHYASGVSPSYLARQLAELPGVEYAEPKWVYWTTATPNDPWWPSAESTYMQRMQFHTAWDLIKGEDGNVVVAVVDGGTDWDHRDLLANIWANPGETTNGIDDDSNGFIDDVRGWNFGNNSPDPTGLLSTPASGQHGTHTGGIVCAVANNATDVTGGSWNAKLMPIGAGVEGFDGAIGFGYEGIVYAAENGADIINCSWGGQGSASAFELEVIEWAMDQGALVVAAAGNQNSPDPHYPSSYPPVLSVANLTNSDTKNSGSNYGVDVDVSAQGTSIRSTSPGNATALLSGTSMSSPHAAAVAALVKTKWPAYTPKQVSERVRVTCDNIDSVNFGFQGKLGRGRVNALRALTDDTPAIRISSVEVLEANGNGIIEPGELLTVNVSVTNYLSATAGISFTMTENSSVASMVDDTSLLSAIGELETQALAAFQVQIAANATEQTVIELKIAIASTTPAYADTDQFEITVLPVFVNHNGNNIITSVTSNGRMGFALALGGNSKDGVGFKYKNGSNLLFEGSLMIGDSAFRVVDSARGARVGDVDLEFRSVSGGTPVIDNASVLADQTSSGEYSDVLASSRLRINVLQQAFQFSSAPDDDYIIIKHTITNTGPGGLGNVRVGYFFDWDIDGGSFFTNRTAYDAARGLGYAWDNTGGANGTYVGMMALNSEGTTSFKGIWNDQTHPSNPDWGVFDGFTTTEKWDALTEGFALSAAGPEDISTVIATGPFNNISPGQEFVAVFAFLGGDNLADLQANADAAASKWAEISSMTPVAISGFGAELDAGDVLLRWRTEREEDLAAFRILRSRDEGPFEYIGGDLAPQLSGEYSFRDPQPLPGEYTYRIAEVSLNGTVILHQSTQIAVSATAPLRTFLAPNAPNPFNPQTTMQYGISSPGPASLVIYDGRGRRIKTLLQESWMVPGEYRATWNGTDDQGRPAASGVYFARLELPGRALQQRMTLLK